MNSTQKVKQHWKILTLLLIATTLSSLITASLYQAFANPVSPSIYLDDLPSSAYYTVKTDGTNEWVVRYDGYKAYEGTDDDTVINWALANLPASRNYMAKVILMGSFTINNPLIVYSWTVFQIDGRIYLASSSNCNMIENANPTTYTTPVLITGSGRLYGNKAGQSSGHGIYWRHATAPSWGSSFISGVRIEGLMIWDIKQDGIYADATSGGGYLWVQGVRADSIDGYGFHEKNWDDGHITNCHFGGETRGIYLEGGSSWQIKGIYLNGGAILKCVHSRLENIFVDQGNHQNGLELIGSYSNEFSDVEVHIFGSSAWTDKTAIKLTSNSIGNMFMNIRVGRSYYSSGTNKWNYGLEEDSGSGHNIYSSLTDIHTGYTHDCVTALLRVLGTGSMYDTDTIDGTIATS